MSVVVKRIHNIIPIIALTILIISIPLMMISHVKPLEIEKTTTLSKVNYNIKYNYMAKVKPSIVYDYEETIGPDKPLYTSLVENILLNITVDVKSPFKVNYFEGYALIRTFLGEKGEWLIKINESKTFITATNNTISIPINMTYIKNMINKVRSDIGILSGSYYLKVSPVFTIKTLLSNNKVISRKLVPTLTIDVGVGKGKIEFSNLTHYEEYSEEEKKVIPQQISLLGLTLPVSTTRNISYLLTISGASLLMFSILISRKKHRDMVNEIISKYGNFIIKASKVTLGSTKVYVDEFKDLVRIARVLGKPIIYSTENNVHTFMISDSNILYVYRVAENSK